MIIERCGWLLGMMLMKVRDCHISRRKLCVPFFDGTGDDKIVIRPKRQEMNSMLGPLAELCYPYNRKSHERRVMVQFDNSPIHNTEGVQVYLASVAFRSIRHSLYGPDLAARDFFLFRVIKTNFSPHHVDSFLSALSDDFLQMVFQEWIL
jgi:hypothetical protein